MLLVEPFSILLYRVLRRELSSIVSVRALAFECR